jgi:hypothetical protein
MVRIRHAHVALRGADQRHARSGAIAPTGLPLAGQHDLRTAQTAPATHGHLLQNGMGANTPGTLELPHRQVRDKERSSRPVGQDALKCLDRRAEKQRRGID